MPIPDHVAELRRLVGPMELWMPGVTAVDPEAVRRAATWERIRKRSTLRGFLEAGAEEQTESGVQPSSLDALHPPSAEVREAMERIRAELDLAAAREADELAALEVLSRDEAAAPSGDEVAVPTGEDSAEAPVDRLDEGQARPEAAGS